MTVHMSDLTQQQIDQRHLRNAFGRFATGVTVITTRTDAGNLEGLTGPLGERGEQIVGRVDQAYGDRNLVCACPPPEAFTTSEA